jgi:hypothetical protein
VGFQLQKTVSEIEKTMLKLIEE